MGSFRRRGGNGQEAGSTDRKAARAASSLVDQALREGVDVKRQTSGSKPFWQTKRLEQMTAAEWESVCDGCGLCCLIRFEDEDTGDVFATKVHCRLFDPERCTCTDYENRKAQVPDCIKLTPQNIEALEWMPRSCGYRRLNEGRGLASWHPLVSGDPESVHRAGVSVRGQTLSELDLENPEDAVGYEAPEWDIERGV